MRNIILTLFAGILILNCCANNDAVTGVLLDKSELLLVDGEAVTLTATVLPHDADNKAVSWRSSIPAIALVSNQGRVAAIGVGEAVISVVTEDGGKTATCTVTVTPAAAPVTGISLDRSELSLSVDEAATLVAAVVPVNATNKTVLWSSSDPSVATVNASTGEVAAISAGSAVISAVTEDGGKTATCRITVTDVLRVMSFNIWAGGGSSVEHTIAVVRESGANIVGIQEEANSAAAAIAKSLGWTSVHTYRTLMGKGCAIISKYPIVAFSASKIGAKLQIGDKYVWMFNQHLNHCPYEPYRLNGIEYCGGTLYTEDEAIASAWGARSVDVERTIAEVKTAQADKIPIFLTGDFNEPSWLDWTGRAAAAGLCKIPVAWPATKKLQEQTGMIDSYRTAYPDEVAKPGYTWTPLPAAQEVLDRIDFVFFWGDGLQLVKSEIAGEKKPESDIVIRSFPSDHRAVVSTFSH